METCQTDIIFSLFVSDFGIDEYINVYMLKIRCYIDDAMTIHYRLIMIFFFEVCSSLLKCWISKT